MVVNAYDHASSRWGLGDVVASVITYFAVGIGLVLLIIAVSGTGELPQGPWLVVAVVGPQASQLLHLLWVIRSKGSSLAGDFQFRMVGSDIGLGFGLLIVSLIAAGLTAYAITAITGEEPVASAAELAQELGDSGITLWLCLFALLGAIFIPLVEELVFRGLLWSALEKRGTRPWVILVVTSAAFAALHLEPMRSPVLFVIGLALGYGRLRTGRLGPAIVLHVMINSLAMVALLVTLA